MPAELSYAARRQLLPLFAARALMMTAAAIIFEPDSDSFSFVLR
jgi:hypothetical protein